jgi:hypothetical protein
MLSIKNDITSATFDCSHIAVGGDLPSIDLTRVKDTMSWSSELRKSAYSFVTDNRFGLDVEFAFLLQRVRQASEDLQLCSLVPVEQVAVGQRLRMMTKVLLGQL